MNELGEKDEMSEKGRTTLIESWLSFHCISSTNVSPLQDENQQRREAEMRTLIALIADREEKRREEQSRAESY